MGGTELWFHQRATPARDHGVVVMTIDDHELRWNARFTPTATPVDAIEATLTAIKPAH